MTPARKEPNMETFTGRFAARLRELREKAKMSRNELADVIGVKMSAIANWENDINMPTLDKLPLIADALKTSVRNLLPKE
ncbi:MAG: helix-turn-helix transcriptional regulator [Thermoguttaceae bacterium]|nr:helix-turn-helix transcriptional regulator [Thermoguttaceae bacterium]MBQ9800114.1 helix-turn-helix transcriptional regulator [Thermoguttaceae bacterium]